MKKNLLILVALVAGVYVMTSCGGGINKTVAAQTPVATSNLSFADPFGPTTQTPLFRPSDENYWYEVGTASGPRARMGQVRIAALRNGQQLIREEMRHAYKGMVSDYSNMIGNNGGTDFEEKAEAAGDKIIDVIVNNTDPIDERSNMDEKGNVTFYRLIRISKKEAAEKIAKAVSENKELKMRFKEEEYRKKMEERFANYSK